MRLTIVDGTQLLEERDCVQVTLPDGRLAGIWRGLAFPLLSGGNAIDVSQEGVSPAVCRAADPPAGSRATGFSIETADDEAYVLLPGSSLQVAEAAKSLQRAGLKVLRTGRHYGDRARDIAADWFVRIAVPASPCDLRAVVAQALGSSPAEELGGLDRAGLLRSEILAARAREASAREEVARLELALGEGASGSAQEIATLRAELACENARRLEAEAEALQIASAPALPPELQGRSDRVIRDEVHDVVEALLPHLFFLNKSLEVMVVEFSDRRSVYRVLRQLNAAESGRPREGKWKTLANAGGDWIESHVSNGNDNSGRVYARLDPDTRIWAVLLSNKRQQARDVAWLRAQD